MSNSHETANSPQQSPLDKPTVSVADPLDGLLPITALENDITVDLKTWSNARPNDTYQLLWNDEEIGERKSITSNDSPGSPLELVLPVEHLSIDGHFTLGYRARRPLGGGSTDSATTPIVIDRRKPGGNLLAPMIFPDVVRDGLTSDELEQLGDELVAQVPGYIDTQVGDRIRTYWGATPGPEHTVDSTQVPDEQGNAEKIMISFSRAYLEALGDAEYPVYYTVTDRAGNISDDATAAPVKLLLSVITPLPNPEVAEAKPDNTLDPADTTAGVNVIIRASANLRTGDVVETRWTGPGASDSKEKTIAAIDAGKELRIKFSSALVDSNIGRQVDVDYSITRNGITQPSSTLTLSVKSADLNLPAPTVEGVLDGVLDPDAIGDNAIVHVNYEHEVTGDKVAVTWSGSAPGGDYTTAEQMATDNTPLRFEVPRQYVVASAGGLASVTYRVVRDDVSSPPSVAQSFALKAINLSMPAPTVEGVFGGVMDPDAIGDNAIIHVDYDRELAGDKVKVIWDGSDVAGDFITPEQTAADNTPLRFEVPKQYVSANAGGRVAVMYQVVRGNANPTPSLPQVFDVSISTPPLEIDESDLVLNGGLIFLPKPIVKAPAGTRARRAASGGKPPYVYASDNPAIATVNGEGVVTSAGNGRATITVVDAAQQRKSFRVVVSNVSPARIVGPERFSGVSSQGRVCNMAQLRHVFEVYGTRGNPDPVWNQQFWSCDYAGLLYRYSKHMATGTEGIISAKEFLGGGYWLNAVVY